MVVPSFAETRVANSTQGAAAKERVLVGYKGFKRNNPMSDKFDVKKFDHVEFWCGDALNTSKRCDMWCSEALPWKGGRGGLSRAFISFSSFFSE